MYDWTKLLDKIKEDFPTRQLKVKVDMQSVRRNVSVVVTDGDRYGTNELFTLEKRRSKWIIKIETSTYSFLDALDKHELNDLALFLEEENKLQANDKISAKRQELEDIVGAPIG